MDRGQDIRHWHRGTLNDDGTPILSSRRLLALCEHIPELGGRWPWSLKIAAESHKEAALHRAALYVGGEGEYEPQWWVDPVEARERAEQDAREQADYEAANTVLMSAGFRFT